jgi:hypothetical protein
MDPIYQQSGWSILLQAVFGASRSESQGTTHSRGATIIFLVTSLLLLSSGFCAADESLPKQIRVSVQYIEVPHPVLTEMLGAKEKGGAAMHAEAVALAKDGQAKILETCVLMSRSGQKATVESIREYLYPCEYSPPELPEYISNPPVPKPEKQPVMPFPGIAFETRNTGVTFEIEPTWDESASTIELRFVPEVTTQVRLDTWMEHVDEWGDASLRMPAFETWRVNTAVTLTPGQFEMVSVITPKPNAPGPAVPRKILVFVRADVITP